MVSIRIYVYYKHSMQPSIITTVPRGTLTSLYTMAKHPLLYTIILF